MAQTGTGYRSVWSMMFEIGLHLVEPYTYTTTLSTIAAPGSATVNVGSLGVPVPAVYNGAQLIIDTGLAQETITITGFNPSASPPTITASFTNPHSTGVQLVGATFPTQAQSGDQFFTQSEILSYIARAQNQYLADVPMIFALNTQTVQYGQIIQPLVCDSIEIHRIASSSQNIALSTLTRLNNVVTAVSQSPHGLSVNEKFAVFSAPDPNFNGAFKVATILSPTSWTYPQVDANALISGGGIAGLWIRLLEVSQEQLAMQNPQWESQFTNTLRSWWEDRAGLYQFGLGGKPSSNFPVEILCSIRDSDTLAATDGFLVPDPFLHYVKYKALEFAWSKDGEQRSPQLAAYAKSRYDRGIAITRRWLGYAGGMGGRSMAHNTSTAGRGSPA
jgi:hypothetical protein